MADAPEQVDLLQAFRSYHSFQTMMTNNLLPALNNANSAAAAVLALEGLYRIEEDILSHQFAQNDEVREGIREFLRKWRCESPLKVAYTGPRVVKFLRKLTIFETFDVPLFIDNYGKKMLMRDYKDLVDRHKETEQGQATEPVVYPQWMSQDDRQKIDIEDIPIDLNTPIVHVTHSEEKDEIVENQLFVRTDKKNIMEGIWFSPTNQLLANPEENQEMHSVYGSWAFETTLRRLRVGALARVAGIRQGEIVYYRNEVNFILYASDTKPTDPVTKATDPVIKATDNAVKMFHNNQHAYTAVSIFVPWRFLPQGADIGPAFDKPYNVLHKDICVKVKRRVIAHCEELTV